MRALQHRLFFYFLLMALLSLTGCISLFGPSLSTNYTRTLQMYDAGGPYDKVIRASARGRDKIEAFDRKCPVGSKCRQKEEPVDTAALKNQYAYLECASYYKLGQLQKAYDLAARPEYEYLPPMRRLLGSIHLDRGMTEKAAREYFYLLLLNDTDGAAKMLPVLEAKMDRMPLSHQTPNLLNLRAARFKRSNDTLNALRDYSDSISADPLQIHAYLERAKIYGEAGTPGKALSELNTALAINRGKKAYSDARMDDLLIATLYFSRGELRLQTSNSDGAMEDFATALRKSKDPQQLARLNFEVGQIQENMDNLDKAIESYKKATCIAGFGDPWYRMAICYAQKSMPKESKAALEALARIDKDKSEALTKSLKELNLLE